MPTKLGTTIRGLFQRRKVARELDEEVRFHLEMEARANLARGMSPAAARRQALLQFGGVDQTKEAVRDVRATWLDSVWQDVRFAWRTLRHSPGFSVAVLATLALGIGANAAIFSVIQAVLLRPFPYPNPDRLFVIKEQSRLFRGYATFATYNAWQEQNHSFDGIAAFTGGRVIFSGATDGAEFVEAGLVSPSFFPLLGARPVLGRFFTAAEDRPGNNGFVVLSYRLWQQRYHGARDIIGRTIRLNQDSYSVLGVLPRDFRFLPLGDAGVWLPVSIEQPEPKHADDKYYLRVLGSRRKEVSLETAAAEMDAIARRTQETPMGASLTPLRDEIVGSSRRILLLLGSAVGVILLIACINVANLQMARGSVRNKEFAIRAALGSGRLRVIRQLLVESATLSLAGGALGLFVAYFGTRFLAGIPAGDLPMADEIRVDWWVVMFSIVISILTGILFGLAPARRASRIELQSSLKEGSRTSGPGAGSRRFSNTLVAFETSLALALLIGAGLMIRTLWHLYRADPGFRTDSVLTMTVTLQQDRQRLEPIYRELLERVQALQGVRAAGLVNTLPMEGSEDFQGMIVEGHSEQQILQLRAITSGYLEAMGIPLLRGRPAQDGSAEVVVSKTLERRYFKDGAIGRHISMGIGEGNWAEIVGVVGDVHHKALTSAPLPEVYVSAFSWLFGRMRLAVYVSGDASTFTAAVRTILAGLDPDAALSNVATMEQRRAETVATPRLLALLLGLFAGAALALSVLGAYSVVSYAVSRRRHEIGIRMALGATGTKVIAMVIRDSLPSVGIGIALGLGLAAASARLLNAFLFEVTALDPVTLSAGTAAVLLSGLIAAYIPGRKASAIDPTSALDCE